MSREARLRKLEAERKAVTPSRLQVLSPGPAPGTWRDGEGRIWREEELTDEDGLTRLRIVYGSGADAESLPETGAPWLLLDR